MAKRISDADRLLTFALAATADQLDTAISTLLAVKRNRFPTVVTKTATKRAPRKRVTPKGVITGDERNADGSTNNEGATT